MGFKISLASIEDLDGLCAVEQVVFDPGIYHVTPRRQYRYLLTKGNAEILKAVDRDGRIAGSAIVFFRRNSFYGRLYSLAVLPGHQGKGLGVALFKEAERRIRKRRLRGMLCEARADREDLHGFYQAQGCDKIGVLKNYYADGAEGIKMRKVFD